MKQKKKLPEEQERRIIDITDEIDKMSIADITKIISYMEIREWVDTLPGKPVGWELMTEDEKDVWIRPLRAYLVRRMNEFKGLSFSEQFYNVNNDGSERSNEGTKKRNVPVVPFLLGILAGGIIGKLLVLILKIIGVL